MDKKSVAKNYRFLAILLSCMVAGALLGWFRPKWGHSIAFLGTVFINMMFCVVVPLVFASIAGSVANMESRQRAGKIMGVTVGTFVITGAIAAVLMFVLMKLFPPVLTPWADMVAEEIGEHASFTEMIVNFFTSSDFVGLLSRRAMLPLIVFSILFGFSVQMTGGKDSSIGKWLAGLSDVMMKFVQIITYYAPIAFFAIFADLVATYGSEVAKGYGRALLVYYPLCLLYAVIFFPLYAFLAGGKLGVRMMIQNIFPPAITAFATQSSAATIPVNKEACDNIGVPKDVSDLVLPMGCTMHMDGSVLSSITKIAFLYGVFGMDFSGAGTYGMAIVVAILSAFVLSGAPGGGLVGEMLIVSMFNFPAEAFPIIATLGFLFDPAATCLNASGDTIASMLVTRLVEGKEWLAKAAAAKKSQV